MTRLLRKCLTVALIAAFALVLVAVASALPQQQGSVDLLTQANGQWDGPGEEQGGANVGASVVGLGDIFHRGLSAIAIGAPEADPGGRLNAGSVYVTPEQTRMGAVDLTALSGRGYRIDGADAGDQLGFSLAALTLAGGDPGLAIGAPYANIYGRNDAGIVYVIDLAKLHSNIDLSYVSETKPSGHYPAVVAVIAGAKACAEAGYAVAGLPLAGEGGGVLIGSPGWDPGGCPDQKASGPVGGNTGAAFVVFLEHLHRYLDLGRPGTAFAAFDGVDSGDRTGAAVSAAGPSGDSFMIGAPYASPVSRDGAGTVYLLHGARRGAVASLAAPPAGSTVFEGAVANDATGFALSWTTDFGSTQHGGAVDLALGAPQASPLSRYEAGEVYLMPAAGEPARVDLGARSAASGVILGIGLGDEAGYALSGLGPMNGNGVGDLAIGAPFTNSQTGEDRIDNGAVYVVYGGAGSLNLDLAHIRARGFIAYGARNSDEAGAAVGGVLDADGDGRPALLVGAPYAESEFGSTPTEGGAVYSVLGFGTPRVHYLRQTVVATVGHAIPTLQPRIARTGPASFSVTPALPRGLSIDGRSGVISGTPRAVTAAGFYTVQMSDLAGVAQATLEIAVQRR